MSLRPPGDGTADGCPPLAAPRVRTHDVILTADDRPAAGERDRADFPGIIGTETGEIYKKGTWIQ